MAEERSRQREPARRSVAREVRRERASKRRSRRRLILGSAAGFVGLLVIAGLFVPQLSQLRTDRNTSPEIDRNVGTQVAIQPGGVIEAGAEHAPYSTSPPTSGPRYAEGATWGTHEETQPDEHVVRNLEVGGIAINHNLTDSAAVDNLRAFIEEQPGAPACFILQPYDAVPEGQIVLTAWGWQQTFTSVDRQGIQAFITAHKNQGDLYLSETCGYLAPTPTAAPTPEPTATAEPTAEATP